MSRTQPLRIWLLAAIAVNLLTAQPAGEDKVLGLPTIRVDVISEPPEWALLERHLITTLNRAGVEFYKTYTLPDGSLRWKERYEGGMNSSDDLYEAFRGFSLHYILGGSKELDTMHRHVWEGITRQFSRYGNIYREFDSNWDWMHHGEGYVSLYPMGMAEPDDALFADRARRFAAMYTGEDPEAQNYDPEHKIIRAVMNGSRGPKLEWNKRDWIPTNANLVYYRLPFDDIPGIDTTSAWINDHPDNDQFAKLVKALSDRMARGDVPINLTVAPLIANAYLYEPDKKYVRWLEEYIGAWQERTDKNNGITPDNVGLNGIVGEYNGGHWWGGYYGWKWVRGGMDIVLAELTAAKVATLLTSRNHWVDLPRSQMSVMRENGQLNKGRTMIANRYDQRGWHHLSAEPAYPYVNLWFMSYSEEDWQHLDRMAREDPALKDPDLGWAMFIEGRNDDFAVEAFKGDLRKIAGKMEFILNEHGDPETWVDSKWSGYDPMFTDNLVRLSVGGLPIHIRGEMLHSQVRYFDAEAKGPGLPPDVAALVRRIDADEIEIELVNTNAFDERSLVIQAGAYGEHLFSNVQYESRAQAQPTRGSPITRLAVAGHTTEFNTTEVDGKTFAVRLAPSARTKLTIGIERYKNRPTYQYPWAVEKGE